jgi:predicted KAP-like P-loop ATPase
VPNDNPIRNCGNDVLGRADLAKSFARHVLDLDATEGAVVGVFGPWGSGKTSFLHLAEPEIEKEDSAHVVHFNPWLFSGTHLSPPDRP